MQSFQTLSSQVLPLNIKDIDTDMIIPAQFLTQTGEGGYGEHVFQRLRLDKNFPMNNQKYTGAQIIVAQDNFGCGSSREHAVWALLQYGIQVVIAPSFSDIFYSNSGKNGLVLITLEDQLIQSFIDTAEKNEEYILSIDLEEQTVITQEKNTHSFDFDPFRKECILKGHNDLEYLTDHMSEINQWQKNREENLYYSTLQQNNS
ncbi:MAG: 3-isopropylmalate dehydratase small subunit [Candidatus Gracilibacteria bacterium]|nr:3-isopropylmalate dehydratase small subunit [Candidatus Gracilibacteria bacterium]